VVVLPRHDANNLPSKEGVHQTRGGSNTRLTAIGAAVVERGARTWPADLALVGVKSDQHRLLAARRAW
ncbi:hypothetical protein, partial [Mycobacterium intracellulare]